MEFLQYDFIQRALLAGLITGAVCPLIGIYVVLRRQSLIGDGLGHIAFAGVAGGYLLGLYPPVGAFIFTVAGAVGIELTRRRHIQYADMGLAIIFYAGMAMAVIFSSVAKVPSVNLLSFLFGSIITVSSTDLMLIALCGLVVMASIYKLRDKLVLMALDEDIAAVSGINTGRINMIFSILTAMVVVVGMVVAGILMVSALMIVPVAAAYLLRLGFKATLCWAVGFSVASVLVGLLLSFYLDIAPGGAIVMMATGFYVLTALYNQIAALKIFSKRQYNSQRC